jgi:L-serine dehydratase
MVRFSEMGYCIQYNHFVLSRIPGEGGGRMLLSDIIGPVMVGPSSSHTAGAVRIGNTARRLLGERVVSADIYLHGSFLATGRGHGTDRAIVAGLLGMNVDDERIPQSFDLAQKGGLRFTFSGIDLGDGCHPNTVKLVLQGESGRELEVVASSIGGGRIRVVQIDGLTVSFSGEYPTLIVQNADQPGHVAEVTSMLQHKSVNIADMQLTRQSRGGKAAMVLECDQEIPEEGLKWLQHVEGVSKVIYLSLKDEN